MKIELRLNFTHNPFPEIINMSGSKNRPSLNCLQQLPLNISDTCPNQKPSRSTPDYPDPQPNKSYTAPQNLPIFQFNPQSQALYALVSYSLSPQKCSTLSTFQTIPWILLGAVEGTSVG
jgi:hypothetical protein